MIIKTHPLKIIISLILIVMFVGFLNGCTNTNNKQGKSPLDKEEIINKIKPNVVSIITTKVLTDSERNLLDTSNSYNDSPLGNIYNTNMFQEEPPQENAQIIRSGTGLIINNRGLIITNNHVVKDIKAKYTVILFNGEKINGEVVARDTINDIALVQIKEKDSYLSIFSTIQFANSDEIQIGRKVIGIGKEKNVMSGVITAKDRSITTGDTESSEDIINLIQTTISINPGDSGGPLVNMSGEVIGIFAAMNTKEKDVSLAIPSNEILSKISKFNKYGDISTPFLGIQYVPLDKLKADKLGINISDGMLITNKNGKFAITPNSPADRAGLNINDVIQKIDNIKITPKNPLQKILSNYQPSDEITITVWRKNKAIKIQLTLGKLE